MPKPNSDRRTASKKRIAQHNATLAVRELPAYPDKPASQPAQPATATAQPASKQVSKDVSRFVLACIAETRKTIEQFPHLTDKQAFALHVLTDYAQVTVLDSSFPSSLLEQFKKLEKGFFVSVGSDAIYPMPK